MKCSKHALESDPADFTETLNPKPQTLNPKPQTLNPKNLKPKRQRALDEVLIRFKQPRKGLGLGFRV